MRPVCSTRVLTRADASHAPLLWTMLWQNMIAFYSGHGGDGGDGGLEHGPWTMTDEESTSKFDSLTEVSTMLLNSHSLTRVPTLRNMGKLVDLRLASNMITKIWPTDFGGATRLLVLMLGDNKIVSIAAQAFSNLAALRVPAKTFRPMTDSGEPFKTGEGAGASLPRAKRAPVQVQARRGRRKCAAFVVLFFAMGGASGHLYSHDVIDLCPTSRTHEHRSHTHRTVAQPFHEDRPVRWGERLYVAGLGIRTKPRFVSVLLLPRWDRATCRLCACVPVRL